MNRLHNTENRHMTFERQITLLSEGIQPQQESEKSDRLPYPPNPINHKLFHTIKNNRRSQSMTEQKTQQAVGKQKNRQSLRKTDNHRFRQIIILTDRTAARLQNFTDQFVCLCFRKSFSANIIIILISADPGNGKIFCFRIGDVISAYG